MLLTLLLVTAGAHSDSVAQEAPQGVPQGVPQESGSAQATCDITFAGSSSLHDFEGKAPRVTTTLHPAAAAGAWDVEFSIPVSGMTTDNDSRDAKMREMLHADRAPSIRVSFPAVNPDAARGQGQLHGVVVIAGVSRDVVVAVSDWQSRGPNVSFDADAHLSLKDFQLEAPTVLGLIRVEDDVHVTGHVRISTAVAAVQQPWPAVAAAGLSRDQRRPS
ncbi:MAG TPA: YceI family protein [Candidatus Binatia bacterium]|jgi:polyisoprenoid-binding protein YceI